MPPRQELLPRRMSACVISVSCHPPLGKMSCSLLERRAGESCDAHHTLVESCDAHHALVVQAVGGIQRKPRTVPGLQVDGWRKRPEEQSPLDSPRVAWSVSGAIQKRLKRAAIAFSYRPLRGFSA